MVDDLTHGFVYGFWARWFLPMVFVDMVKGTRLCSNLGLVDWGLRILRYVHICIVALKGI